MTAMPIVPEPDPVIEQIQAMHWISPVHRAVAIAYREGVIACVDHDLAGPVGGNVVYAICSKCSARFKVQVAGDLDG